MDLFPVLEFTKDGSTSMALNTWVRLFMMYNALWVVAELNPQKT